MVVAFVVVDGGSADRAVLVLAIEGVVMLAASATTLSDIRYFVCRVSRLVFYVGACSIYGVTFQSHSLFDPPVAGRA